VSRRCGRSPGGTIARDGTSLALEHDPYDQLTAVVNQAQGTRVSYSYDGLGRRVLATDAAGQRRFLFGSTSASGADSPQLILDGAGNLLAGYAYAGDRPLMRFGPDGPVYYLEDALGSAIGLTNPSGAAVARFQYDGFGNLRSASGPAAALPAGAAGDFRFQGGWLESATGLYDLGARDYDPHPGRFLSRDPAQPVQTVPETYQPYTFADSNPYLYRDPSGRQFDLISINISIGIDQDLESIQAAAGQQLRQFAVDKIRDLSGKLFVKFIKAFVPGLDAFTSILALLKPSTQCRRGS
jgi:RHS repeat-associated protein